MPDGSFRGATPIADQHMFGIPAALLGMWSPWLVGGAKLNAQIQEGFGMLASEWQNFVSGRLKEDLAFIQRIMQCRTPNQVWPVHLEFWQKAMDDYGEEYLRIGRLAGSLTSKAAAAAQCATKEAGQEMWQLHNAA
jgi:hypothetical protein